MATDHAKAVSLADGRVVMAFPVGSFPIGRDKNFMLSVRDGRRLADRSLELTREGVRAAIDVLMAALEEWPESNYE